MQPVMEKPKRQLQTLLLAAAMLPVRSMVKELYTTNTVCKQNNCINPIFPGLQDLKQLESQKWAKHELVNVQDFLSFCGGTVTYDIALPLLNKTEEMNRFMNRSGEVRQRGGSKLLKEALPQLSNPLEDLVREMDAKASRAYFLHLAGMGLEPWEFMDPDQASSHPLQPCAQTVARLTCFTYFPMAFPNLKDGQEMRYVRPCKNSCENYVHACNVDCCDEGVSCVWDGFTGKGTESVAKTTRDSEGIAVLLETGYADIDGPCLLCTGGGKRSAQPFCLLVIVSMAVAAFSSVANAA